MKPLRPILRDNPNERVRALLSSAQLDVSPSGWRQRALLAVAPALPLASDIADLTVDNGADAIASIAPKVTAGVAKAIAVKWAAIGAIAGGSLSATVMHAVDKRSELRPTAVANVHRSNPEDERRETTTLLRALRERDAVPEPSSVSEPAPAISDRRTEATTPSQVGSRSTRSVPMAQRSPIAKVNKLKQEAPPADVTNDLPRQNAPTKSLGEEVRSLNRIRQLSVERTPLVALEELDRHQRQYPMPSLGIEAEVLRLDLLWSAGQKSAAQVLAEKFLSAHPDCPHSQHVRSLLRQNAGPPPPKAKDTTQ